MGHPIPNSGSAWASKSQPVTGAINTASILLIMMLNVTYYDFEGDYYDVNPYLNGGGSQLFEYQNCWDARDFYVVSQTRLLLYPHQILITLEARILCLSTRRNS